MNYSELATKESLEKTSNALTQKGYNVLIVENKAQALEKIKELIPQGSEVMNGSSTTLNEIGYSELIKSKENPWNDLHAKITAENDPIKRNELRKKATMSEYYLGSIHALTEGGEFIIASNTGSQLPHVVFTSPNLIFVVGTQKIVQNLDSALDRLTSYIKPLEDERMKGLYGVPTNISKILIFKDEAKMIERKINIILVKEKLGF